MFFSSYMAPPVSRACFSIRESISSMYVGYPLSTWCPHTSLTCQHLGLESITDLPQFPSPSMDFVSKPNSLCLLESFGDQTGAVRRDHRIDNERQDWHEACTHGSLPDSGAPEPCVRQTSVHVKPSPNQTVRGRRSRSSPMGFCEHRPSRQRRANWAPSCTIETISSYFERDEWPR